MTMTIAAIVISLAAPAFVETLRKNRLTTQANTLIASLNLARSEAVKRNALITVCASNDQASCSGSWEDGWVILDNNNQLLRAFDAMDASIAVTSAPGSLQYAATGFLGGGATTTIKFNLCATSGDPGRQIDIPPTGRPNNVTPYPTC